jgi:hypothetical protein
MRREERKENVGEKKINKIDKTEAKSMILRERLEESEIN